MKLTKSEVLRLIRQSIISNRDKAINALNLSGIDASSDMDDKLLFNLVLSNLESGNVKLIANFGYVLDDTFDMSTMSENFSGGDGKLALPSGVSVGDSGSPAKDTWFSQNKGKITRTGISILRGWFGGGDKTTPVATNLATNPSSSTSMMQMMQMQQAQAQAQATEDARRREDADKRSSTNMMIGLGVGGVLVVGLIIFLAVKK